MKKILTSALSILTLSLFLCSCSSLENLSVKWKYRKDYWVKKSSEEDRKLSVVKKEASENTSGKNEPAVKNKRSESPRLEKTSVAPEELLATSDENKEAVIGASLNKKAGPASKLEKKAAKIQKKLHKTQDNGSTWGVLSLIFGILGLVGLFIYGPAALLALLALIFGIIGASGNKDGKGFAIAGILMAVVTLLILLFGIVLFSAAFF